MPFKVEEQTKLHHEIRMYADLISRYFVDPAWAEEQEREAAASTGGNVSALEAIAMGLQTRLSRLLEN